jgi:hypothetical protein
LLGECAYRIETIHYIGCRFGHLQLNKAWLFIQPRTDYWVRVGMTAVWRRPINAYLYLFSAVGLAWELFKSKSASGRVSYVYIICMCMYMYICACICIYIRQCTDLNYSLVAIALS